MMVRYSRIGFAALSLTALGLLALPTGARAQGQDDATNTGGGPELSNRPIKLNLENTDLYTALKLLFAQAKAQYSLDPQLRGIYVTLNITQPFRIALETLLKSSNTPYTYRVENGVYSVVPREAETGPDAPPAETDNTAVNNFQFFRIPLVALSPIDMAFALGGRIGSVLDKSFSGGGQGGGLGGFGGGGGGGLGGGGGGLGGGGGGFGGGGGGGLGGGGGGFGGGGGISSGGGGGRGGFGG